MSLACLRFCGIQGFGIIEANWKPKTVWTGDCLDIMRGMNSECVDLIYLDPPFNSKVLEFSSGQYYIGKTFNHIAEEPKWT